LRRIILSNRRFCIFGCIIFLIVSLNFNHHQVVKKTVIVNNNLSVRANNILKEFRGKYIVIKQNKVEVKEVVSVAPIPIVKQRKNNKGAIFTVSAYTINFESTGKSRGNSGYGITSTGYDLKGKSLVSAKVIAVDPNQIPIGSLVKLTFLDEKYKKYDDNYRALDKGGLIKGRRIDLFFGDSNSDKNAINFGKTQCYIEIIKEN